MSECFRVALAFLRRNLLTSHPVAWLVEWLDAVLLVSFWYFTTHFFGILHPTGVKLSGDYFSFSLIGVSLSQYVWRGFTAFSNQIREAQAQGSLESLWVSATPLPLAVALSGIWDFLAATLNAAFVLAIGVLWFGAQLKFTGIVGVLAVIGVTSLAMGSLGLLSASWTIASGRGDFLRPLLYPAIPLVSGAFFPVALFPGWLQAISWCSPMTHALTIARGLLLPADGGTVAQAWMGLLVLTGCWTLVGWGSLFCALHQARINGRIAAI